MRILHLSDTPLSGSPIRISQLLAKYGGVESRHICWEEKIDYRIYEADLIGHITPTAVLEYYIYDWADIIHYHNRWRRQEVFRAIGRPPPKKPCVIQLHSPRDSEDFRDEVNSGIPLACLAQYHPRQWPEMTFLVPNVVDINDPAYLPARKYAMGRPLPISPSVLPIISFAPSNTNRRDWNDKGYSVVNPVLKRMRFSGEICYDLINRLPFELVMPRKRIADIGIDDVITGSYHLSALEYMSLGVPCINHVDALTEAIVKNLTGADHLPLVEVNKETFERVLRTMLKDQTWLEIGEKSRKWMETYWSPEILCKHYLTMYEALQRGDYERRYSIPGVRAE